MILETVPVQFPDTPSAEQAAKRTSRHYAEALGGYVRAQLLFQLDLSTPARPRPVVCLFMIAKRSNVLSCRSESVLACPEGRSTSWGYQSPRARPRWPRR